MSFLTKHWFRLKSRNFSEATFYTMLKQNSVQKDPFPLNLELYHSCSYVMTEGTDLNQLICKWKIQKNGKSAGVETARGHCCS